MKTSYSLTVTDDGYRILVVEENYCGNINKQVHVIEGSSRGQDWIDAEEALVRVVKAER